MGRLSQIKLFVHNVSESLHRTFGFVWVIKITFPAFGNTSSDPLLFPGQAVMPSSSINSLYSPISNLATAVPVPATVPVPEHSDRLLWNLLHNSDHHRSDTGQVGEEGLAELSRVETAPFQDPITVGSPDWVFVCGSWSPQLNTALILKNDRLVAALQKENGQLKLITYDFLSARLIEALFELGIDARMEDEIGDLFWKRAETVAWRHGLGTLGYSLEAFSANVSAPSELEEKAERILSLSNEALPSSFGARQLRILYKYG